MAYEETMVCDGCANVLTAGSRREMLRDLRRFGGDEYIIEGSPRHLCGHCTERRTDFFDGVPIPRTIEP